jgi:cytochrome c-type biogenesis protein CcmF
MTPEIGHLALWLALAVALVQAILPLVGAARRDAPLMAAGQAAAYTQFALVAIAFLALTQAYVTSDFSVANVAQNSHSAKPLIYKIAGVWGNHEGSMVLWVLMLSLFGAAIAAFGDNLPASLGARVLSVQAMIGVAFLAFIVLTSNPFERLDPAPIDGRGLNPILQDPGLAFHPPFLYLGYVGLSTAYSFAVAALIEGRVDPAWARWVRPWTLAAWSALTLGIAMGSWWAYYELGWGGWWYWDPVENASFMPWLIATALLHSASVVEKRDALRTWTVLLAILGFALSLIGTFLVRSGVLMSVHAFAVDPSRGLFILVILAVAIGGSLALYAWRAPALGGGGLFAPISREGGIVLNNFLLTIACAAVLLGTLYPLFHIAWTGNSLSVGPPWFNFAFSVLTVPLVAALGIGPLLAWKRGDFSGALARMKAAGAVTAVAVLLTVYVNFGNVGLAPLGIGLAVWVAGGVLREFADRIKLFRAPLPDSLSRARHLPRAAWGMTLAHLGVAVFIAGVTGVSAWKSERIETVRAGDKIEIAGYTLTFRGVERADGSNYTAQRGVFDVTSGGRPVTTLSSERRYFPVQRMSTTKTGIHTTGFGDLYVALSDPNEGTQVGNEVTAPAADGPWVARIYHNPLVPWIWIGALIMVFGGLVSLSDRRHRVGAPARARRRTDAAVPAQAAGDD